MPRKGLTKEQVVQAAAELIEQHGTAAFSMRALAESLNIKTASLYNHVYNMNSLITDVCIYALKIQYEAELRAIEGKNGTEAIMALANTYRKFAKQHRELYRLIMNTAASCNNCPNKISTYIVEPFMKVLKNTCFNETDKIHWQRILRGIVHGFVSQEEAGFFVHLAPNTDDSFKMAIQCYTDGMSLAEKRKKQ